MRPVAGSWASTPQQRNLMILDYLLYQVLAIMDTERLLYS